MNYVNENYDALNIKFKKFKKKSLQLNNESKKRKFSKKKKQSKTLIKNEIDNITFIKNFVDFSKKYDVLIIRNKCENDNRFIIIDFFEQKTIFKIFEFIEIY